MNNIDAAIEAITRIRILMVKENRHDIEEKLHAVELILFKVCDNAYMPDLKSFKARRERLNLSLRDVAAITKVSAASISRIERGCNAEYNKVVALHEFYTIKGV